jgi:hypothetical protein
MVTYARAIDSRAEAPGTRSVGIEEWTPPHALAAADRVNRNDRRHHPDILDNDFITFHRCLREFMMDEYGLLSESEAFHLHEAIAPCITLDTEVDGVAPDSVPTYIE